MIACENGHLEVIQWLLAHGGITCDHINVKDNVRLVFSKLNLQKK